MKKPFLLLGIMALSVSAAVQAEDSSKVIYGNDDRYEVSEYPDAKFRELAKSTAGMVRNSSLRSERTSLLSDEPAQNSQHFTFNTYRTLESTQNVCKGERFADQVTLPRCSGFLVGPDTLVTAGHCVTSTYDCLNYSWVFDYVKGTTKIKKSNVYGCKKVIGRKQTLGLFATKDYAVIQLDRKVTDREPLEYRKKGKIKKGTELVVIGHPSGLPTKIADGAEVTKKRWNFFYANLDTYGGNSGSAVFNKETGLVEGILIQGEKDYVRGSGYCYQSNRLSNSPDVAKEKVFKITKVKELE